MKNAVKVQVLGALALLAAGWLLAGCKSAPKLTQGDALTLIQAKYDHDAAAPVSITIGDLGMRQGVMAKYWTEAKRYPNGYWADFTLTAEGKQALTLANGGDVIQWRPQSPTDKRFYIVVQTVAANHLKARNLGNIEDEVGGGKSVSFSEDVNLDGVPAPLQNIAHDPGNKLSTQRQAVFTLQNGVWTLQSIV